MTQTSSGFNPLKRLLLISTLLLLLVGKSVNTLFTLGAFKFHTVQIDAILRDKMECGD